MGSGLNSWGLDSNMAGYILGSGLKLHYFAGVWTQISVDKEGSVLTIKPKVGFVLNSNDGF